MQRTRQLTIMALLVIGLLGALWVARGRVAVERANRIVALCVDDLEVRQLAALTGRSVAKLLRELRERGATHLAVTERTLGELLDSGQLRTEVQVGDKVSYALPGELAYQIARSVRKIPGAGAIVYKRAFGADRKPFPDSGALVAPKALQAMRDLGLGYDPAAVAAAATADLRVVARPSPEYLLTPEAVDVSLSVARETGAKVVVFNGVSVAGGPLLAQSTAEALTRRGLRFGYVELVPMAGNPQLAAALKYGLIRTHSISQDEMLKTPPSRGLDRFVLAVTERNVRLCYARLHLTPRLDAAPANLDYIGALADELKRSGYALGEPAPFSPLSVPAGALPLLALGAVGGGLGLLDILLRPGARWFWAFLAAGALVALVGPWGAPGLLRVLVSLAAAIIFPTLAVLHVVAVTGDRDEECFGADCCPLLRLLPCSWAARPWLGAIGLTVRAAAITTVGGLIVAAALSSSDYLMQVSQFRGVKLTQTLPLLIVLVVMVARSTASWRAAPGRGWPALRAGLNEAGEAVVKYWHAIAIMAALGAVAFMLLRSGNESAVEVPAWERSLRALLDQLLVARPRTKEIAVGYPALFLGLLLLLQGRPRTVWVLLTAGVIGQMSVLNTFCHLHTPLLISVLRVANGLWLGLAVGIAFWLVKLAGERALRAIWWQEDP